MEATAKKYAGKTEFLFIYCREAHPEGDPRIKTRTKKGETIKQALTMAERKATAQLFCEDMKATRRILLDEFVPEQSAQRRYGGLPNPTVVIDVEGRVALKMPWTNGTSLDRYLEKFLAGGGKFDAALAETVPVQGPGKPK
jgi:hypothetical protein